MKRAIIALLFATAAFLANAAEQSVNPKSNADSQDGDWKPISAVLGGAKLPKLALDAITLRISGENYEVTVRGEKEPDRGTRALDESTNPKRITIRSTSGPNRGKTFLGIYELSDTNSMRVCYDLSGAAFPAKFESTSETGYYLVEYRRAVAKPPTDAAQDAKKQNGSWKPAGAMLGGTRVTREELKKITLSIKDGDYKVVTDGLPQADIGTITLDSSVTPKRMTLRGVEGPNKDKTILAIYEMGGRDGNETFRICYDLSGKAFPTAFTSPKGSMHYLVGYRRASEATEGSQPK